MCGHENCKPLLYETPSKIGVPCVSCLCGPFGLVSILSFSPIDGYCALSTLSSHVKVQELPNSPREGRPRRPDVSQAQVCRSRTGCLQAHLQGGVRGPQLFHCEIGLAQLISTQGRRNGCISCCSSLDRRRAASFKL